MKFLKASAQRKLEKAAKHYMKIIDLELAESRERRGRSCEDK
jgi:hypothetical protein